MMHFLKRSKLVAFLRKLYCNDLQLCIKDTLVKRNSIYYRNEDVQISGRTGMVSDIATASDRKSETSYI